MLYDDACGFCRRWVPFWGATLARRGFTIAPLQSRWAAERLPLPGARLTEDLRLLLSDGGHVEGAEVYRYVMRRIWWAYPAYLLSIAPVFRTVFDWAYRTFATNRHRISRACRLDRPASARHHDGSGQAGP